EPAGLLHALGRDRLRVTGLAEHGNVDLTPQHPQLLDGGGALEVGAGEKWVAALLLEPAGELGRRRRLAGALKTRHEHDRGRPRGIGDLERLAAEGLHELVVHDLDDLLRRREALRQVGADALLLDASDEALYDLEVDVGLEQREPDLAQDLVDLGLAHTAAASQAREDRVEAVGEGVEHPPPGYLAR